MSHFHLLRDLVDDERGFIISAELVIIATVVLMGLMVGLKALQAALVGELSDVGAAIGSLDQSYRYNGFAKRPLPGRAVTAYTSGSFFLDARDEHDGRFSSDFDCWTGSGFATQRRIIGESTIQSEAHPQGMLDADGTVIDSRHVSITNCGDVLNTDGNIVGGIAMVIDAHGAVITTRTLIIDAKLNIRDAHGVILGALGVIIDTLGNVIDYRRELVDERGLLIGSLGIVINAQGNVVDLRETRINAQGIILNAAGKAIGSLGIVKHDDGKTHTTRGCLIDAEGKEIDLRGTRIDALGNVIDTRGNITRCLGGVVDSDGAVIGSRGMLTETLGKLVEFRGSLIDTQERVTALHGVMINYHDVIDTRSHAAVIPDCVTISPHSRTRVPGGAAAEGHPLNRKAPAPGPHKSFRRKKLRIEKTQPRD